MHPAILVVFSQLIEAIMPHYLLSFSHHPDEMSVGHLPPTVQLKGALCDTHLVMMIMIKGDNEATWQRVLYFASLVEEFHP